MIQRIPPRGSGRSPLRVQHRPHALQHRQHRALLVAAHLPERSHVPPRHDQAVATRYRVAVAKSLAASLREEGRPLPAPRSFTSAEMQSWIKEDERDLAAYRGGA